MRSWIPNKLFLCDLFCSTLPCCISYNRSVRRTVYNGKADHLIWESLIYHLYLSIHNISQYPHIRWAIFANLSLLFIYLFIFWFGNNIIRARILKRCRFNWQVEWALQKRSKRLRIMNIWDLRASANAVLNLGTFGNIIWLWLNWVQDILK